MEKATQLFAIYTLHTFRHERFRFVKGIATFKQEMPLATKMFLSVLNKAFTLAT